METRHAKRIVITGYGVVAPLGSGARGRGAAVEVAVLGESLADQGRADDMAIGRDEHITHSMAREGDMDECGIALRQRQAVGMEAAAGEGGVSFAIVSPEGNARTLMDAVKQKIEVTGSGSPKIASGQTAAPLEQVVEILRQLH